jgi:Aspartyl/Asparaginyl beta-hydroxylase
MNSFSLKLPFIANVDRLYHDLQIALKKEWPSHYNTRDYTGDWKSIALYSASGKSTDVYALPAEQFQETELLNECHYFRAILNDFKFEKEAVRLLRLAPGSEVLPHRDRGLAYRFDVFRLHIPIVTAAEVNFIVAGKQIDMKAAECWYADFDQIHSVNNKSEKERVHLVIDGKRNAWTDELFLKAGYRTEDDQIDSTIDEKTKAQIRSELLRQGLNPDQFPELK